jgi:predicted transcriptional regulator
MDTLGGSTSELSEKERYTLGFLIDLEDRGSEWPPLTRIVNAVGITHSGCESMLARLAGRGFVHIHVTLDESTKQYAITRAGRACYFA